MSGVVHFELTDPTTMTPTSILESFLKEILAKCAPGVTEPDERMWYKPALVDRETREAAFWLEERRPLKDALVMARTMTVELESTLGRRTVADEIVKGILRQTFQSGMDAGSNLEKDR